ncbi:hypothetical protein BJV77DRAFT_1017636 [Russula vinacea]|nr:hypothetical protein BJV77DRAFT_1017636 [Russula vinacea]
MLTHVYRTAPDGHCSSRSISQTSTLFPSSHAEWQYRVAGIKDTNDPLTTKEVRVVGHTGCAGVRALLWSWLGPLTSAHAWPTYRTDVAEEIGRSIRAFDLESSGVLRYTGGKCTFFEKASKRMPGLHGIYTATRTIRGGPREVAYTSNPAAQSRDALPTNASCSACPVLSPSLCCGLTGI